MRQTGVDKSSQRARPSPDVPSERLREVLQRYERNVLLQTSALESVSVEVTRQSGFSNLARTPAGLPLGLDEPVSFGGSGLAPDPAECLLAAVGSSVSVTLTAYAALRAVSIERIHVVLSAAIDAREFFRPGRGSRAGLLDTTLTVTVASSSKRQLVRAVVREALRVAPVLRALKRRPLVRLVLEAPTVDEIGSLPAQN